MTLEPPSCLSHFSELGGLELFLIPFAVAVQLLSQDLGPSCPLLKTTSDERRHDFGAPRSVSPTSQNLNCWLIPFELGGLELFLIPFAVAVQLLSHVQLFVTPRTTAYQPSLSITNSQSLLKSMFIELVMPSNHLFLCHPLLLLPSIFPSIGVFSNESALCIRWPKYWSFSISPSSEYSGLISFQIDCFDLLAVQGTLKSLLQHHSSKASILQCSDFSLVQISHPYMTTGKKHT